MRYPENYRRDIHYVNGNYTRIDPEVEMYPLYVTYAATQYRNQQEKNAPPILPIQRVMDAKEFVDNIHL